jgi:hypothetical protein
VPAQSAELEGETGRRAQNDQTKPDGTLPAVSFNNRMDRIEAVERLRRLKLRVHQLIHGLTSFRSRLTSVWDIVAPPRRSNDPKPHRR